MSSSRAASCRLVLALLPAALGACAGLDRAGTAAIAQVSTAELCTWSWNLVSGAQMRRELARRGGEAACQAPAAAVLADAAPSPQPVPAGVAVADPPPSAPPVEPPVAPAAPRAAAATAAALPRPGLPGPEAARRAAVASATAPLVTPACAERLIRRGEGAEGAAGRAVAFRNRCGFGIRVIFAPARQGALTAVTGIIPPGATSADQRLEDGFEAPGYVVCSYEAVPATAPCRLGESRGAGQG